jgi:hypothetical protein
MPGWKRDVGRRLDALIVRTVPGVRKAVRWNPPFYGIEGPALDSPHRASHDRCEQRVSQSETRRVKGQGWFLGIHCFTKYVKVAFFRPGAPGSLRPVPPGESKTKDTRYLDIHEDPGAPGLDEAQMATWIRQALDTPLAAKRPWAQGPRSETAATSQGQAAALPGFLPVAPTGILASSPSQ